MSNPADCAFSQNLDQQVRNCHAATRFTVLGLCIPDVPVPGLLPHRKSAGTLQQPLLPAKPLGRLHDCSHLLAHLLLVFARIL